MRNHDGSDLDVGVWPGLVSGDRKVAGMEEGLMVLVFPFLIVWICSWPF
jgi:hypothetical protein